ncbi:MAG TPA: hypothetical protein VFV40_10770 [Nocardioides sp.]|nr:hypothetical protein [Nocardioides sp.]
MPVSRAAGVRAVATGVLAAALLAGCGVVEGVEGSASPAPDGRMVMVSGRDDHGLLAQAEVPVYGGPGGRDPVGRVADGTLLHVHRVEGTWLEVSTAEGRPVRGWVDDYFLRGEVRLVGPPPSCSVELAGSQVEGGTAVVVTAVRGGQVLVTAASGPGDRGWVPRRDLQELPPQGAGCGEDPPGGRHRH